MKLSKLTMLLMVLNSIPNLIRSLAKMFISFVKGFKNGEVSTYTGMRINGKRIGILDSIRFYKKFFLTPETGVHEIQTNQGTMVLVHGSPSEKFPYQINEFQATQEEMISHLTPGKKILMSCHNAYHKEGTFGDIEIIRDAKTCTKYSITCLLLPIIGVGFFFSNREIEEAILEASVPKMIVPGMMNQIEEGYDNNIWEILTKEMVEENKKFKEMILNASSDEERMRLTFEHISNLKI